MTPYNQAAELLRNGASSDDVVAQLSAAGVSVSDARTVLRAVVSKLSDDRAAIASELAEMAKPIPKARPVEPVEPSKPVEPGFYGWLMAATVLLVPGCFASIGLLAWRTLHRHDPRVLLPIVDFALQALATPLLITGTVMLLLRKRWARSFLVGWTLVVFLQCAWHILLEKHDLGLITLGFPLLVAVPFVYFLSSRQLVATASR